MRSTTLTCLLAAFQITAAFASEHPSSAAVENLPEDVLPSPELPSSPEMVGDEVAQLELRQATAINQAATQNPLQYPTVTVQFLETVLPAGATTWLPFTYTQTFAAVPDQWPSPLAGNIGYGSLSKTKRDAVAEPTGNFQGIAGRIRA